MARSNNLPHWPRLLSDYLAAAYVGISKTNFLAGVEAGHWPKPVAYGRRRLWDRLALDQAVDRLRQTEGESDPLMEALDDREA